MKKLILSFVLRANAGRLRAFALMLFFASLFLPANSNGQPLELGQSIVTSFDAVDNSYNVVRMIDIRNRPPFITGGSHWVAPQGFGPNWTKARMGNVFGIAIDDASMPNIFVTSSTVYCDDPTGTPGHIFRIRGDNWQVADYVVTQNIAGPPELGVNWLPNTGPALGNICHDIFHNQQFVTNHEDGRIYAIKDNGSGIGIVRDTLDPFKPDDGTAGFAPRGERLWGIGAYGTNASDVRVYFSRWRADNSVGNALGDNEIWSVALDNNGYFVRSDIRLEINLPPGTQTFSNPVSDIEFSFDGDMLLGERTMNGNTGNCAPGGGAHNSRILEFPRNSGGLYDDNTYTWHRVGALSAFEKKNSSGGVDFQYGIYDSLNNVNDLCDSIIVGTGDYMFSVATGLIYGVQVTQRSSAGALNVEDFSHYIDINGIITGAQDKSMNGDIDVYREDLCSDLNTCMSIIRDTVYCDSSGTYIYEFQVQNNSPEKYIEELEIAVDSPQPPNYVVAVPSTINVSPTIPPNGISQVYRVTLQGPGAEAYGEVCYTLSAHFVNDDCPWCCYIENCIKLPECGSCAEILQDSLYCVDGEYYFNFTLQNGTIYNVTKIQLTSPGINPVTFVPQVFNFSPAIAPGQTFPNLTAQILGGTAGMQVPVRIKLFSNDFECCYFEELYTLPSCDTTNKECECGEVRYSGYRSIVNGVLDTNFRRIPCLGTINAPDSSTLQFEADYICNPKDTALCQDTYKIKITSASTGNTTIISQSGLLNYQLFVNDNYAVTVYAYCGGQLCDTCLFKVNRIRRNPNSELKDSEFGLGQNYPNPFNPATVINFAVPTEAVVDINIYDVSGRLVKTLVKNETYEKGVYSVPFDGSSLPSGMYFYRLKANGYIETRKMLLIK